MSRTGPARPSTLQLEKLTGLLLPQRKREQPVSGGDGHILAAIHCVADGAVGDLSAEHGFPEELAGARIERIEISLTAACEDQVRGSRQNAAVGDLRHLERPFDIACFWIDRLHGTEIALVFSSRVSVGCGQSYVRREAGGSDVLGYGL